MNEVESMQKYRLAAVFSVVLLSKIRHKWGDNCSISRTELADISLQTFKAENHGLYKLFDPVFEDNETPVPFRQLQRRALYFRLQCDALDAAVSEAQSD